MSEGPVSREAIYASIVRVEEQVKALRTRQDHEDEERRARQAEFDRTHRDLKDRVYRLEKDATRSKGFIAGVLFVFTAVGALVGSLVAVFWDRLIGGGH